MPKRKGGVNKSAMIREILTQNPKTKAKDIVAQMDAKGHKVATSMVYFVKSRMRRAKRKQIRQKVARATGSDSPVELIRKVKELAADTGGLEKLKQLVEILGE